MTIRVPRFSKIEHSLRCYFAENSLKLTLFLASVLLFSFFPNLDLEVTALFYSAQEGFYLNKHPVVEGVYRAFAKIHFVYLLLLVVLLALPLKWMPSGLKLCKKRMRFLLVLLFLGPGLLVNVALKDNSTGRARPNDVSQFGGDRQYSTPFVVANQCHHNCSFVSGHASAGFFLIALAWVFRSTHWLVIGTLVGAIVGFGRVVQGGHFLSDVVFCFWVMYFTMSIMARVYKLPLSKPKQESTVESRDGYPGYLAAD